jgi:hypothetical protein
MKFIFIPKGRLGNAIFRYLGCSILCIKYNGEYSTDINNINCIINDKIFIDITNNSNIKLNDGNYLLSDYYQHDNIYKIYKTKIINFINNHNHIVITDGINAGDGNKQYFYMKDILNTPPNFNKIYDVVFHIRLGDFLKLGLDISLEKLLALIQNIEINNYSKIAVVCDKCNTEYEKNFRNTIKEKIYEKFNKSIVIESNDILTDYYIMKNSKILICSNSTLSWCASYFSNKIEKCYMPKHYTAITNEYCDCYYPIDNTELYNI